MRNVFTALLFFISIYLFSQDEKRLALVIGNANYDKGELKNPVNDARLIASTLDSLDFDVILKENLATKREMLSAVKEFGSKRSEYDVAFVYYAGHGIQVDNENFLLPTKEVFEEEFDVMDYGVSVQNIMRYLRAQTNEVNILILDACRDNPFESKWNTTRSLKGGGLAKIPPPTGSLIAFSTDSGNTAPDGDGDNSVYSLSLAKNMLLKDVSIDQVFRNVRAEVLSKTDGVQRPVEATQLTGESFYLVKRDFDEELKKSDNMLGESKVAEAIALLESIYKSQPNNLEIVEKLSKAYSMNGSLLLDDQKEVSEIEFNKAFTLLNNYIPEKISVEMLDKDYEQNTKIAYLFYRKSRLLYLSTNNQDWDQIFLNIKMAIKYDLAYPYWDYYLAAVYDEQYEEGDEDERILNAEKYYEKAIIKYKNEISKIQDTSLNNYVGNAESYFYLGFCYYNLFNLKKDINNYIDLAFEAWDKTLKGDPENTYYLEYIGNKYYVNRNYNKSLEIYNRAIVLCNDCAQFYNARALINYELDNIDDAINDFNIFYKIADNEYSKNNRTYRADSYFEKALRSYNKDEHEIAVANYKNAIEDYSHTIKYINNNDITTYAIQNRAYTYYMMSASEYTLDLNYHLSLEKSNIDYKSLIDKGIFGENIEFIDRYLNNDYLSGNYYDLIQNAKTIIEKYSEKLNSNEKSDIYTSIGMTYWTINNNDKALEYYKKALDLNNSSENYNQYAVGLFQTGDNENALYYFNKSIELEPENHVYLHNRGYYYYQIQDYKNAEKDFKKSESLIEGFDLDNTLMLMKLSVKKNNFNDQLFYANRILEEDLSNSSEYWISEIYLNQKRYLKSLIFISKAIDEKRSSDAYLVSYKDYTNTIPDDSVIITLSDLYINRGNLFKLIGNKLEACEDYNRALMLIDNVGEIDQLTYNKEDINHLILENCN